MFTIRFPTRVIAIATACALLVAACGSDSSNSVENGDVVNADESGAQTVPTTGEASEPTATDAAASNATPTADSQTSPEEGSDSDLGTDETSPGPGPGPDPAEVEVLSAYLAVVDTASPAGIAGLSGCDQVAGDDAIPVVFSVQIDESTLDPSDFSVETAAGAKYTPTCATLRPADETDEGYTVLMTGPLGDASDRPISVSVVGPLASRNGTDLSGLDSPPITDGPGPTLILAIETDAGTACAALGSDVEIQTVWQSSVNGSSETAAAISFVSADGEANPTGFDDDSDSDNHLVMCVPPGHETTRVEVEAGSLSNPAGLSNPEIALDL